ncbi:MAG: hypothetical protein JSS49_01315 [Planctomycetes bacterium]|nr:hypothetical protein [Planctomycetota bacterium]
MRHEFLQMGFKLSVIASAAAFVALIGLYVAGKRESPETGLMLFGLAECTIASIVFFILALATDEGT